MRLKLSAMIPTKYEFLKLIAETDAQHETNLTVVGNATDMLGTALSHLYRIATCHDGCRDGDHRFESLSGRAYNHASGALLLIRHGYYDEARNLTRSIGEIANLFRLFYESPPKYQEWVTSTRGQRISNFSPRAVRQMIEESESAPPPMDRDQYQELCETATHPTPDTIPNHHTETGGGTIGGIPQESTANDCVDELTRVVCSLTLFCARMMGREDLFVELYGDLQQITENAG